jgi:DNA-binding NarL/FixJ family response regulator
VIRVLIVDDHEVVREGLKAILAAEPDFVVVGESASADQLVRLVDETRPDVVVLDARLPGVSGAEACRNLSEARPETPVLILSTYGDEDLVDECIRAGAKGYVVKDIERFTLKQSIRAVQRGQGAVSPEIAARILGMVRDEPLPGPREVPLNERQLEILRLMSQGLSNREIAERTYLSENTIKSHVQEIFKKLEVRNRVEAAMRAAEEGWL